MTKKLSNTGTGSEEKETTMLELIHEIPDDKIEMLLAAWDNIPEGIRDSEQFYQGATRSEILRAVIEGKIKIPNNKDPKVKEVIQTIRGLFSNDEDSSAENQSTDHLPTNFEA